MSLYYYLLIAMFVVAFILFGSELEPGRFLKFKRNNVNEQRVARISLIILIGLWIASSIIGIPTPISLPAPIPGGWFPNFIWNFFVEFILTWLGILILLLAISIFYIFWSILKRLWKWLWYGHEKR